MKIPLTKPYWGSEEKDLLLQAFSTTTGTGDGAFSQKLKKRLSEILGCGYVFPVTSCTHALELAMRVLGVTSGDEVILPSFTMTSTANAVVLTGATPVFADIDPHTYCIDPADVERAITAKTKGIIIVHYGGMACDMVELKKIAKKHSLFIVEDAAHSIGSTYFGKPLGTLGIMGAFSFHGTKNVSCGEGGVLVTGDKNLASRIEIFRANGTNRNDFLKGLVAKYHWIGPGSSYFLSDFLASIVVAQLRKLSEIRRKRTSIAERYMRAYKEFSNIIQLPVITAGTKPNWHIFALKFSDSGSRQYFVREMHKKSIEVSLHYAALHSSPMGLSVSKKHRDLPVTDDVAVTLVRLPLYPGLSEKEIQFVIEQSTKVLKRISVK